MAKLIDEVGAKMSGKGGIDLSSVLVKHDTLIRGLDGRIGHVERTLGEHGSVLHRIETAVTKQDARPTFNFHQSVSTVLSLAVLFSMVVGGIIWVTQSQFSGVVAEQKGVNAALVKTLERHEDRIEVNAQRLGRVEADIGPWLTSARKEARR